MVEANTTYEVITDKSYIDCSYLRKFHEDNPLSSVFDLEDQKTVFKIIMLRVNEITLVIFEFDIHLPQESIQEVLRAVKSDEYHNYVSKIKSLSGRARLTLCDCSWQVQSFVTKGDTLVRETKIDQSDKIFKESENGFDMAQTVP